MSWRANRVWPALVLALAVGVLAVPGAAAAEDVESLLRAGVRLRHQGHDREALATFQRAAAIERQPRVVAQIGLAEQALGMWPAAAEHVDEALTAGGDAWISKNRGVLERAFQVIKAQVGRMEVWGSPDGAEVLLDGRSVGRLPGVRPLWVGADPVQLTVRASGFLEAVRSVQVHPGELRREHVELRPVSLAAPARALAAHEGAGTAGAGTTVAVRSADDGPVGSGEPEQVPVTRRWWFWTAIAAAVVGAGVATAVVLSSRGGACDGVKGPCTVYTP